MVHGHFTKQNQLRMEDSKTFMLAHKTPYIYETYGAGMLYYEPQVKCSLILAWKVSKAHKDASLWVLYEHMKRHPNYDCK